MDKYVEPDPRSLTAFPIARAGYPYIGAAAFSTAVLALLGLTALTLISLAATFFICYFFRDPDRVVPTRPEAVVSPADGKVIAAGLQDRSPFHEGACLKVSIFMSVFNVHVNRIPHEGRIKQIRYFPGKFFSANLDKASRHNEHNAMWLETDKGQPICFVQIAGLIARRIICYAQEGDRVQRGQRFGLICFGSRLDIYLPPETLLKVAVGDRVSAGTTVLGDLK